MQKIFEEKDINLVAKQLLADLGDCRLLVLIGDLGAGKTALARSILKAMGYGDRVVSPSFVLEKIYQVNFGIIKQVVHIDFYRLDNDQVGTFDWSDYLGRDDTLVIVEWPDRVANKLPKQRLEVKIEVIDDKQRQITY